MARIPIDHSSYIIERHIESHVATPATVFTARGVNRSIRYSVPDTHVKFVALDTPHIDSINKLTFHQRKEMYVIKQSEQARASISSSRAHTRIDDIMYLCIAACTIECFCGRINVYAKEISRDRYFTTSNENNNNDVVAALRTFMATGCFEDCKPLLPAQDNFCTCVNSGFQSLDLIRAND